MNEILHKTGICEDQIESMSMYVWTELKMTEKYKGFVNLHLFKVRTINGDALCMNGVVDMIDLGRRRDNISGYEGSVMRCVI